LGGLRRLLDRMAKSYSDEAGYMCRLCVLERHSIFLSMALGAAEDMETYILCSIAGWS
jgi:hypothetical protein